MKNFLKFISRIVGVKPKNTETREIFTPESRDMGCLLLLAVNVLSMLHFEETHSFVIDKVERNAPVARDAKRVPALKRLFEMLRVESWIKRICCDNGDQACQLLLLCFWQCTRLFPESWTIPKLNHASACFRMWARNFSAVVKRKIGFSAMAANVLSINSGLYSPSGSRSAIRPIRAERISLTSCCSVGLLMQNSIPNRASLSIAV